MVGEREQVDGGLTGQQFDAGLATDGRQHRLFDRPPGGVGVMHDARGRVRRLRREVEGAGPVVGVIELDARRRG